MRHGSNAKPAPPGEGRWIGNLIVKVEHYDNDAAGANCYPGSISGIVMGGQMNGRQIDVRTRITPTNSRVPTIADLQDGSRMVHTPAGGYLALENVRVQDGGYTTQWINKMGNPDAELRVGSPMQISPSIGADGTVRRFRSNGATIYNGFMLRMNQTEQANELGELQKKLAAAIDDAGAAVLAVVLNTEQGVVRKTLSALRGWRDGEPAPIEDSVQRFFAINPKSRFTRVFGAGGVVDVVPMEVVQVGPKVAESMDLGVQSSIPLKSYLTGGLGARIEAALRRTDPTGGARLEGAFLEQAHANAKSTFAAVGWKGVWNCDIERYFGNMGITLPRVPRYGFAVSTAVLRPYGDDPADGSFLAKSRAMTGALPRNALPTRSDPTAVTRFNSMIAQAVESAVDLLPESPAHEIPRRNSVDNDAEISNREPSGQDRAASIDRVFGGVNDRVEPDFGEQMDF